MLNPKNLGIAGGIIWGLCISICTILGIYFGYAEELLNVVVGIYPGYAVSWTGVILGFIYGFIDAFIGLWLLAWLYNKLNR
ncbi:MAG: hypothetical protein C5B43_00160 [Verrucomicrobia bacterium]|nr:MAG: hypothetical protein C5B43_00160 [Verrucomicrobiota bacterium]